MSTTAAQNIPTKTAPTKAKKQRRISWEKFQKEYLTREDEYKYEWAGGIVEKTKRTMDYSQFPILSNLLNFFFQLKNAGKVNGQLISEGDMFF